MGFVICEKAGNNRDELVNSENGDGSNNRFLSFLFPSKTTTYNYDDYYDYQQTTYRPYPIYVPPIKVNKTIIAKPTLPPTVVRINVTVPPVRREPYVYGKDVDYNGIAPRPATPIKINLSATTTLRSAESDLY